MASPFNITALTPTVPLDEQRLGNASYTVTNVSGAPIRGRARLVALGNALVGWLQLVGEVERDFAANGTHQYTVKIAVPPEAAAGDYVFRLDMVGVENPDDQYSEGQTVTFNVPEGPEEPDKPVVRKGYLETMVGAVVGVLSGIAAGFVLAFVIVLILTATVTPGDLGQALALVFLPFICLLVIGFWVGSALGGGVGLNVAKLEWARETSLFMGGTVPVLTVITFAIVSLLNGINETLGRIFVFVGFIFLLIVPALVARAIVLKWKTGEF